MSKLAKVVWITLLVFVLTIYIVGAVYLNDELDRKEKSVSQQLLFYDARRDALSKQKDELMSLRDALLAQLNTVQEAEQEKELSLQLSNKEKTDQIQKAIEENKRLQAEQARIDELMRQAELRRKSKPVMRKRSRAS